VTHHPYREPSSTPDRPAPKRWGATWVTRIATWAERRRRSQARAELKAQRANVLACHQQIRSDAGFLYACACTCGFHAPIQVPSRVKGEWAERWPHVDPKSAYPPRKR